MLARLSESKSTWFFALICCVAFCQSLRAQTQENIDISPREHQEFLRKAREGELTTTGPAQRRQLKLAQIREDFRRIQSLNAEKIRTSFLSGNLDYQKISKASADIERRAVRLKSNLALPDAATMPVQTSVTYLDQMKRLDAFIWNFVSNPVFRNTEVIDVQLAEKASQDLRGIIEVSGWLKTKQH